MLISRDNARGFMLVGDEKKIKCNSEDAAWLSVKIKNAFEQLTECNEIVTFDFIVEPTEIIVRTKKGPYHDMFYDSMTKNLIWDTELKSVNYPATLQYWRGILLNTDGVSYKDINLMQNHDLDDPKFDNFKHELTMFLLSCYRDDKSGLVFPSEHWIENFSEIKA